MFQWELRTLNRHIAITQQVRQLQQMIDECDTKATGVAAGYDECAAALRDDFAKTLADER